MKPIITKTFDWTDRPHTPLNGKNIRIGENCALMGIELEYSVDFGKDNGTFLIGTYQAFNAMGLIGPEKNGIFVLDDTRHLVILDEHLIQSSGYFGASKEQFAEVRRISKLNWKAFKTFVNSHPRHRHDIGE